MLRYLLDTNVVIYAIKNRPSRCGKNSIGRKVRWRFLP